MNRGDPTPDGPDTGEPDTGGQHRFEGEIRRKARRRLQARREGDRSVWKGLGLFGMVGWSVTLPTVLCLAVGLWIDRRLPGSYSWTLMFLLLGITLGCWNAWAWIRRELSDDE